MVEREVEGHAPQSESEYVSKPASGESSGWKSSPKSNSSRLKRRELVVLAEAPALGVPVSSLCGERESRLLVGGREVFNGGRVKSLNFGKCGPGGVVTGEVELVTGLLVRENMLGRRRRRGAGAMEHRWRRRCHDDLAGLSSSYVRTWYDRRSARGSLRRRIIDSGGSLTQGKDDQVVWSRRRPRQALHGTQCGGDEGEFALDESALRDPTVLRVAGPKRR